MKRHFPVYVALFSLASFNVWNVARANPEPTAYDSRGIAMGLTGVTYLERPAAIAINPANLDGIDKFSVSLLFNPLFVLQSAPVQGPGSKVDSGVGFGPLASAFVAGRASPRVVFGGGVYIETGYGSTFKNITNVDGTTTGPGDTDPQRGAGNTEGEDLKIQFFVGEVAFGGSVRVHKKLKLGLAIRVPFAIQDADLYQNVGAALNPTPGSGPGVSSYSRVKNHLAGMGFPSPRFGITYEPLDWITVGASYRAFALIPLSGTTKVDNALGLGPLKGPATAEWRLPHAIQFGIAFKLLEKKLLLAFEQRFQFHDAKNTGNEDQTVSATVSGPMLPNPISQDIVVPFDWRNVSSTKIGVEYKVNKLIDVRGGFNAAISATSDRFAQYFTPPPGLNFFVSTGVGFNWKKFDLDLATAAAWGGKKIGGGLENDVVEVGGKPMRICSVDQVTRTGCRGEYTVLTIWGSITGTYHM